MANRKEDLKTQLHSVYDGFQYLNEICHCPDTELSPEGILFHGKMIKQAGIEIENLAFLIAEDNGDNIKAQEVNKKGK